MKRNIKNKINKIYKTRLEPLIKIKKKKIVVIKVILNKIKD